MRLKLKKKYLKFLQLGIVLLLFPAVVLSSLIFWTTNENFYASEQQKYNVRKITGLTQLDLNDITASLIKFITGKKDNLDIVVSKDGKLENVFSKREKLHMGDVQNLFKNSVRVLIIAVVMLITFMSLLIITRNYLALYNGVKNTCLIYGFIVMLATLIVSQNFNYWFTIFHKLAFDNDLWLLDPRKDVLIQMMPLGFFVDIVQRIIITSIITMLFIFGASFGAYKQSQKGIKNG